MDVASGDYSAPAPGLDVPASTDMPQALESGMPTDANVEAPVSEAGFPEAGQAYDDAPLDEDGLRQQLQTEFETRFAEDRRKLQSTYQRQINDLESDLYAANEASYVTSQQLRKAYEWVQQYIEANNGDPRDAATFQLQVMGAERGARNEVGRAKRAVEQWLNHQHMTHRGEVQRMSIDPETGRQLFDPNDPTIEQNFRAFVEAGRRYRSRGGQDLSQDPATRQAWERYRSDLEAKARAGLRGGSSQPGHQAVPTPAENRERAAERGPQNRLSGGSAAVTDSAIMDQAMELFPGDDRDARLQRQAFFVQERRKNGIQG